VVEDRFAARQVHAADRDGDDLRAGRLASRAGRIGKKLYATASSPLEGVPDWTSA